MKVADVMTRNVVAASPETPLKDVASLLVDKGISGLPVVDAAGAVVGVVSEADFVIKERGSEGSTTASWRASSASRTRLAWSWPRSRRRPRARP